MEEVGSLANMKNGRLTFLIKPLYQTNKSATKQTHSLELLLCHVSFAFN